MTDYITQLRERIWRRVRRLHSASPIVYHEVMVQFWNWIHREPFLQTLLVELEQNQPAVRDFALEAFSGKARYGLPNEEEQAAYGYKVIELCVKNEKSDNEERIGSNHADYMPALQGGNAPRCCEVFNFVFVEPLAIWLDEKLESNQRVQKVLLEYKERSEWFRRDQLRAMIEKAARFEDALVLNLLEYLHNQRVDVFLEPLQRCGRPDLVSVATGPEAFVADGKVYRGEGPAKIGKFVRQVYDYLCEQNKAVGYLVIFRDAEQDVRFVLPANTNGFPFLLYNHKYVYFVVVNISSDTKSASERPRIKFHEVTQADLVVELKRPRE